jgi:glycine cleavage system H protein
MTVVLVVLTLAIFILIDYAWSRKRVMVTEPKTLGNRSPMPKAQPECVSGILLPANIRYHPGHTWALRESPTLVRVGIDNLAARMIGRAESILLPRRGQWIRQGQKIFSIFKDGTKTELVSPIEGEVTSVNEAVVKAPILLNSDPYGDGWLLTVISPDAETNFRNLLGGDLARQWMEEEESRLSAKMPAPSAVAARDDGNETSNLSLRASSQGWAELTREFFLM